MTEKEKCFNNCIISRLSSVKENLDEIYECLGGSEVIYNQIDTLSEIINMLKAGPEPKERKHCYCKDCAYFPYSEHINGPWRECMRSKYVQGKHEGELRHITANNKKCRDFIPAGEKIDYHEGIKELLNNIQIKESEGEL